MTSEDKALALVNEVLEERRQLHYAGINRNSEVVEALCRAIEQRDAAKQELADFKQKVSDAAEEATDIIDHWSGDRDGAKCLQDFIIPKPQPDPLVEVAVQCFGWCGEADAEKFRRKLDALGFEIRKKNDG